MTIENNLKKLNILLPKAPDPVGAYVAYKKTGNLLFISGQLPIDADGNITKGKIGKDLNLEERQKATRLCVINILAQVKKALDDDKVDEKEKEQISIEVIELEKKIAELKLKLNLGEKTDYKSQKKREL